MSTIQDMEVATTPEDFKVTNVYEVKEVPDPTLVIRAQSPDEEFDYLLEVLENEQFHIEHGYTPEIPDNHEFMGLFRAKADRDLLRTAFVENIYDAEFYKPGIEALEQQRATIEKSFPQMQEFNKKWGFNLFEEYQIALTRYGTGGKYNMDTGVIIMMTREDGAFKRANPSHTAIHEMVHFGIQVGIVKKFDLTHAEKERLVDLIVSRKFETLLPGYVLQPRGDKRLDDYITEEAFEDLPSAIERYVKDFPRTK